MDFKDNILQLAERIKKQKDAIQTEEATKNAFIMPIITALGYDVFNPFEVVPEMDCDLTRKGDKIDYAIKKDGRTILLIECKHCKQNLDLHNTQLSKYYAASNARFGVLTNGIEYRFYADLDKTNIMDEKPFLVVNMLDLSDADIEEMKKFHKSCYNESEILSTAKELQMMIQIKEILAKNFQSPGDEFTRYFVRSLNNGKSTPKLIEEYRPIVRKSILSVIGGMISGRPATTIQVKEEKSRQAPNDGMAVIGDKQDAVITCKETDAYNIIRVSIRPTTGIKPLYTTIATVTMNLIVSAAIVLLNPYVTVYISYKIPPFALSVHIPDVSTSIYVEVDSKVLLGLPSCDKAFVR